MRNISTTIKAKLAQKRAIEGSYDPRIDAISRQIWPWSENKLLFVVLLMVILDFFSTFAFLELSGKTNVYESGPIARWALETGGFFKLAATDILAVSVMMLIAICIRKLYTRLGFKGYGRLSFILVLAPYTIITFIAVVNNFTIAFI